MLRIVFAGMPVLIFVLGLPLATRVVPPNRFYGFRTPTTFSSLEAWYQINFATGLAMMAAGAASGAVVLLLSYQIVTLKPENRYVTGILLTGVITLLSLLPAVIYSNKF